MSAQDMAASLRTELRDRPLVRLPYFLAPGNMHHAPKVVAQDTHGHEAMATLLLRMAQPLAGLAPTVVSPGQRVALWAVNLRPSETVRVYVTRRAGRPLLTGVADRKGHGYWPLAVPYGSAGKNQ